MGGGAQHRATGINTDMRPKGSVPAAQARPASGSGWLASPGRLRHPYTPKAAVARSSTPRAAAVRVRTPACHPASRLLFHGQCSLCHRVPRVSLFGLGQQCCYPWSPHSPPTHAGTAAEPPAAPPSGSGEPGVESPFCQFLVLEREPFVTRRASA